jgi:hypothetical protein
MPLFPRRTLQRLLHECRDVLPEAKAGAFATAFNSPHKNSLALQWELVLLAALREIGGVQYEPDTGGSRKLDFLFHGPDLEPIGLEVRAVSNLYNEERNPLEQFQKELARRIAKAGLQASGYRLTIGNRVLDPNGKRTMLLALPERKNIQSFFDAEFDAFLRNIFRAPGRQFQFRRWSDSIQVQIDYAPTNALFTTYYKGLDATSLRDNSVFKALENKAKKIRTSRFEGPVGIVVCDAGAQLFYQEPPIYSVTLSAVVSEFLREHSEVSAVLAVLTYKNNASLEDCQPRVEVYENPSAAIPFSGGSLAQLRSLAPRLPNLQRDAFNAQALLGFTKGTAGIGHFSYKLNARGRMAKIRVSARGVFALLAGAEDCHTLLARMSLAPNALVKNPINPFAGQYKTGARLVAARILETPEVDDDWIEFEFEGADPASAPIKP